MKRTIIFTAMLILAAFAAACGSGAKPTAENPVKGQVIKSGPIGTGMTVTLSSESGKLKNGQQDLNMAFTDADGKAVDVGAASLNFHMPEMGSMAAMNEAATLTTTGTPGVYSGKVRISMLGDWQAQIAFEGAAGKGKTMLPLVAQ
ncbi:MAG TPA: FixH family protein [Pyrinomonadaceae bacterium]|nr:FixH family protein [Pyrinomonadaceae bacterium]